MKKLLFLRLGAIGDVVQSALAIALLKRNFANIEVHWLVSDELVRFVLALGVADVVVPIKFDTMIQGSIFKRIYSFIKARLSIAKLGKYDILITGHSDFRYSLLLHGLSTFSRKRSKRKFPILDRYRVFEFYRLMTNIDSIQLDVTYACDLLRTNFIRNHQPKKMEHLKNYVVLIPGGAKNKISDDPQRRWPINHYVALASNLLNSGVQVVISGGYSDRWVSDSFKKLQVVDLIGESSLLDLFYLLDNSTCVVSHDTGPLHVAIITRTPLVAIFGPTVANSCIPYGRPNTIILQEQNRITCSPCYDGSSFANCDNNVCMSAISPNRVYDSLQTLIQINE